MIFFQKISNMVTDIFLNEIIDELQKVIPSTYLFSKEFKDDCSRSPYANSLTFAFASTIVGLTICDVRTEEEKAEQALNYICHQIYKNGVKPLYRFVIFLLSSYCKHHGIKLKLKGLRIVLRKIGIKEFVEIDKYANDVPLTIHIVNDLEKWDEIKEIINGLEKDCRYAETTIDYQNVGNSCRHILVKVAQLVYDPQIHNNITENGKPIGKTDAVEMLSSYFSYTLKGKHNKYLRDYSQAANDLANKLTHDTSATRRDMLITVSAIINLIYLVGTLSNKFNQDLI